MRNVPVMSIGVRRAVRGGIVAALMSIAALAAAPAALAQGGGELVFLATRIELSYATPHPQHPSLDEVARRTVVELVEVERVVYARDEAPDPGPNRRVIDRTASVADIGVRYPARLDASALSAISRALVRTFAEMGIGAVQIGPDPSLIGPAGEDLRFGRIGPMKLIVRTARVTSLRTIAAGERVPDGAIDHPEYAKFLERSPVRPASEDTPADERKDLLRPDALEEFVARIGRHPRRYARAIVRPDEDPSGDLALDLVISEAKPWLIYGQLSNTGTEATGDLRYRLGLINNQFTGNDDTLSLAYVASGVGTDPDFRAVVGSYEAPFLDSERLRWRVYGSWSEFTAAELGEEDDAFLGETGVVGASLEYNIAQFGDLFVDLTAGLRLEDIETENRPAFVSGSERLLIPSVGVRLEKFTLIDELTASLRLEAADASWTGADELGLTFLGRSDPSDAWAILAWDADYSFYLEPMIDRQGWEDPNSPETSTLAHEVALALRGQWSLDHRLIPQQRGVVGGLYSVRGYPESVAAGDSMFAASAEYRFHLPRVLGIEPDPNATPIFGRPFRVAPQQVYGAPDWDLVLKAFADTARTWQADARPFESDEILFAAGVGLELALKNNLTARLDYALPATSVITGDGDEHGPGDNRVHFSVTASY